MELVILVILLALSAFFSGSETAYFSLRPSHLAELKRQGGRGGQRAVLLVEQAHSLLSALLIGNLLVNIAASVVATSLAVSWIGPHGLAVAVPVMTILLLLVGEITPKLLALRFRQRQAVLAQAPLTVWLILIKPLLAIITAGTERMLKLLPMERSGNRSFTTRELETACDLAVEEGRLTETEGRFLARLILLQDLEVHQIMTPRPDVVTLDTDWTRDQVLEAVQQAGFNRYPVVSRERNQPLGFFHLKDLLARADEARPLGEGLRSLLFVPESKDVAALLIEFRGQATHFAAVVDEHGDFSGIVTMADCLQALLGPVGDVVPAVDAEVYQVDAGNWIIGGRLDLREVNEACKIALPASRDYVTVAGFIMARLGRIAQPGDRVEAAGARFTVLQIEGHKIVRVQVEHLPPSETENGT